MLFKKTLKKVFAVALLASVITAGTSVTGYATTAKSTAKVATITTAKAFNGSCSYCGYEAKVNQMGSYPGHVLSTSLSSTYDADVVDLQVFLWNLSTGGDSGYSPGADYDGHYGSKTKRAVMYYQSHHGLAADGKVGRDTWSSMKNHD